MKILKLKYQRNGVAGEPFTSILFEDKALAKEFDKGVCGNLFLAIITETPNDRIEDAKVENLQNFDLKFRGDRIGYELQKHLDKYCEKLGVPKTLTDALFPKMYVPTSKNES